MLPLPQRASGHPAGAPGEDGVLKARGTRPPEGNGRSGLSGDPARTSFLSLASLTGTDDFCLIML